MLIIICKKMVFMIIFAYMCICMCIECKKCFSFVVNGVFRFWCKLAAYSKSVDVSGSSRLEGIIVKSVSVYICKELSEFE